MQRLVFTFLFVLIQGYYLLSCAQEIYSGANIELPSSFYPVRFVLDKSLGTCYLISATAEEKTGLPVDLHVQVLDGKSLSLLKEQTLNGVFKDRFNFFPERVLFWNDSLRVFGSMYNKQEKAHELWVLSLSSNLNISSARKVLSSPALELLSNTPRFMFQTSENGAYLSVSSINKAQATQETTFYHWIYDGSGTLIKKIEYEPDYVVESFRENRILLDEAGNLYMTLSTVELDGTSRNYLYAFPVLDNEVVQYALDIPGKEITDVIISLDAQDNIQAAGIFKERFQKNDDQSGIYFFRIDRDQQRILSRGIHLMDGKVSGLYLGSDNSPKRGSFSNFKVIALLNALDTGVFLAIEEQKKAEICETDPRTGLVTCELEYFYGNIWYFKLNEKGDLDWLQKIEKGNQGINTSFHFLSSSVITWSQGLTIFTNQPLNKGGSFRIPGFMSQSAKNLIIKDNGGEQIAVKMGNATNVPILPQFGMKHKGAYYFISQPEKSKFQLNVMRDKAN